MYYRDCGHSPYNPRGTVAQRSLRTFATLIGDLVKGGKSVEEVLGEVAGLAAAWRRGFRPTSASPWAARGYEFLDSEGNNGVSGTEATGFLVGAAVDASLEASLEMRFRAGRDRAGNCTLCKEVGG